MYRLAVAKYMYPILCHGDSLLVLLLAPASPLLLLVVVLLLLPLLVVLLYLLVSFYLRVLWMVKMYTVVIYRCTMANTTREGLVLLDIMLQHVW